MKNITKSRCYNLSDKKWMKGFLISPSGSVYEVSELGDGVNDIDTYLGYNLYLDNIALVERTSDVAVSFFTGEKDIEGNEVYFGDIIEYFIDIHYTPSEAEELKREGKELGKIKILEIVKIPDCYRNEANSAYPFSYKNSKVIGNIWDNPELLEKTKFKLIKNKPWIYPK